MPYFSEGKTKHPKGKPWKALRKREGTQYFLGWFATKVEAEAAEKAFDDHWPPNSSWRAGTRWNQGRRIA